MKTGTPPSKPTMSARPPVRNAASLLDDLAKVSDITEAPSRAAAQTLDGAGEGGAPVAEPAPVEATAEPAAPSAPPKAKPAGKGRAPMPWDEVLDSKITQQVNFKLPLPLLAKLKFLGETTYGESMTSIVRRTLEAEVARQLKERGLS